MGSQTAGFLEYFYPIVPPPPPRKACYIVALTPGGGKLLYVLGMVCFMAWYVLP